MSIAVSARVKNQTTDYSHLREGSIIPDVSMVGETVSDETQTTLLNVLLDGVESLLLRNFHLSVGPSRDFNNHVEDPVVLVREEGNVMERGDDLTVTLDENAVICTFVNKF